jgi:hypothetical protein
MDRSPHQVFLRKVETINRKTGQPNVAWHRAIACEDRHARFVVGTPVEAALAGSSIVKSADEDAVALSADAIPWGEQ